MSLYWRTKILLFKPEATYGTDPAPTGGANAMQVTDLQLMPMQGTDIDRDLDRPYLGGQPHIAAEMHAKLTFKVEMAPSGAAGTAPAWGPLMRACAMAETIVAATSVTYNPISDAFESGTFWFYAGNTLYNFRGARGTFVIRIGANAIPYLEFEFTGLYSTPAEDVRPTPDLSSWKLPRVASDRNTPVFTIGGTDHVLRSFALNAGNKVENRFLINSEAVIIADKQESLEMTIEAVPLTILDPYTLAENGTTQPVVLSHGTVSGGIARIDIPSAQILRPEGLAEAQGIIEWPLRGIPVAVSGNDQWTLTLT